MRSAATYCTAVRGGPSDGHMFTRAYGVWGLEIQFLRYASGQTYTLFVRVCTDIGCRHADRRPIFRIPRRGDFNEDVGGLTKALVCPYQRRTTVKAGLSERMKKHVLSLDAFEMKGLRKVRPVSWTAKKTNEWALNKAGVKRELLDTVKARKIAHYGHTMRKQGIKLPGERDNARNNAKCT